MSTFVVMTCILRRADGWTVEGSIDAAGEHLVVLAIILMSVGEFRGFGSISGRTCAFLVLSGFATGASWICYSAWCWLRSSSASGLSVPNWLGVALIASGAVLVALT